MEKLLLQLLITGLMACIAALFLTPLFIRVALALNLVDNPDGKLKHHKKPTPYLGGLAVYCSFLIALIVFLPLCGTTSYLILGTTLLVLLGLIDDCFPLEPYQKFLGQAFAALCFIRGGLYLKETFLLTYMQTTGYFFWVSISTFWILSVINAFNLVDVMDGLAGTLALTSSCAFLLCALAAGNYITAFLIAALIGALIGFMRFNLPPASIYLGDAGSLFIGGVMSVIPFMISWGTFSSLGFLAPPIILALPLLEGFTLIVVRLIKGIPFYNGSRDHFCHYLIDQGWSKYSILAYTVLINMYLFALAYFYLIGAIHLAGLVVIAIAFVIIWYLILFRARSPFS